jgi:small-conductance mechanosensitive channel
MDYSTNQDSVKLLQAQLDGIANTVRDAAASCQGNPLALLALLRQLEQLHREIRDEAFVTNLPDNRQALYSLLKDIEAEGGWPYIERMRLQELCANCSVDWPQTNSNGIQASQ